jgi:4-hydroxy-2-oxoheptanedioate aldolase
MPAPKNKLKAALAKGEMQIGLWLATGQPLMAEIGATAGYDWCLIDGEHAPNDIPLILAQLQAMNGAGAAPVVRVPIGQDWILKQVLDIGAQTVMVPMVETAKDAAAMVRAVRYPPDGARGLAASMVRASGYNAIPDYASTANDEICLIVQVESARAIENIDTIAAVDGVDVVFIGPSDLSADMGFTGNAGAPEVKAAVKHAVRRIRAAGKAVGIIGGGDFVEMRDLGVTFLGLAADVSLYAQAVRGLASDTRKRLKDTP